MVILFIEERFLDVCRISYHCRFRSFNTRHVFFFQQLPSSKAKMDRENRTNEAMINIYR